MKIPAITAALAALVLCTALAPQAQATSGIRRCVNGTGIAVRTDQTAAQNIARGAAASKIVNYLRNGYQVDSSLTQQSCNRRVPGTGAGGNLIYFCRVTVFACKYRHDG